MTTFQNLAGRLKTGTSNPSNPQEGDMYYNTDDHNWMRYNGTTWMGLDMTSTSTTTTSTSTTTTSTSTS